MPEHIRDTDAPQDTMSPIAERLIAKLRKEHDQTATATLVVERVLESEGLRLENVDAEVLTDLVYAEWVLRIGRGAMPSREEYLVRFPMIAQRLCKQWSFDQSLESLSTDRRLSETLQLPTPLQPVQTRVFFEHDHIGKYKVISRLGTGGQAEVYRALHPILQRDVVIKLLSPRWPATSESISPPVSTGLIAGMLEEGRLLARLSHPHIALVYDVDQTQGRPFLVMEFVQGLALDQYHRTHPLNAREIARLLTLIARAVAAAHARGIVHLDIKPQNVVVDEDGTPKLIDFGLAKLTDAWNPAAQPSGVSGTIGFMSPEQARAEVAQIGPASDIFSLGATLYYLLTGQPPYHSLDSLTEVGALAIFERARRCEWDRKALTAPSIPVVLAGICAKAMSSEPAARFSTASRMADALEAFPSQRQRAYQLVAVAALLVVAALGAWLWQPNSTEPTNANSETTPLAAPNGTDHVVQPPLSADLKIFIHREDAELNLTEAVPVPNGEHMSIVCRVPANLTLMFFVINGDGKLQHIISRSREPTERQWRYPEDDESTVPLTGPLGTECLLIIGHRESSGSVEQIQAAWDTNNDWPRLPPSSVLRLVGSKVLREQFGRDLGVAKATALSPTERISRTLERFAGQLGETYPLVEGLAFSHAAAIE